MQDDRPPPHRVAYEKGIRNGGPGWLGRVLATVAGAIVFVAAAMMSLLLLAVVFGLGTIVVGYLWWKTRELRKQARAFGDDGRTIDVEVVQKDVHEDEPPKP